MLIINADLYIVYYKKEESRDGLALYGSIIHHIGNSFEEVTNFKLDKVDPDYYQNVKVDQVYGVKLDTSIELDWKEVQAQAAKKAEGFNPPQKQYPYRR